MKRTIRATVKVAGIQRERRFAAGTKARIVAAWKRDTESRLRKRYPVTSSPRTGRSGQLAADVDRYLSLVKHLADWKTRRAEIRHWLSFIGHKYRHTVTREDVLRARGVWKEQGIRHKTINNRVTALRDLYRKLDGDDAITPCDGVKPMPPQKVPPKVIDADLVNRVCERLRQRATQTDTRGRPVPHAMQDRARLMVLATTGKRPCEIERATPDDVDIARRVWLTRDAKGGYSPGVYLNDEMLIAWQAFIDAEAWGKFPDHFPRRLRDAGWPKGVKPYNLRHTTWIAASEAGADLADIQAGAGHKRISTTRLHYVPVLNSRMQRLSEMLDGRFGWQRPLAGPENKGHNG